MYYLYSILCLMLVQTKATSGTGNSTGVADTATGAATGSAPGAPAPPTTFMESMIYFLPAMLAMMLVYLLVMKPPAKEGAKNSGTLPELKKNDRVVTAGGIVGTVVKLSSDSEYTTIRVDESSNAKMQVLTSSIVKVLTDDKEQGKAAAKKS
jgi:preprotein translocase subunit YajC